MHVHVFLKYLFHPHFQTSSNENGAQKVIKNHHISSNRQKQLSNSKSTLTKNQSLLKANLRHHGSLLKSVFSYFQFFTLTKNNEVQFNDDKCLDAPQGDPGSFVEMITCHGLRGNQEWKHDKEKVNSKP